jgi:hypothetical protein
MSYDLQIFTCSEPMSELMRLVLEEGFERAGSAFTLRGSTWQLLFHSADKVEPEDIPPAVFRELPGLGYMVTVNIEGDAPIAVRERAVRLAKKLARASRGVLVNPQEDTTETARGIKRVDFANVPEEQTFLTLSWWFEDAVSFENTGYAQFVEVLESHAPEALPRRYGLWEPPQFKLAEHGREHFLSFFHEHVRDSIVWYANPPFSFVFLSIPPKVGGSRLGYRSCRLQLNVQSRVLQAPGWSLALKRLWLAVAQVVSPFFAEIREGKSSVKSWWWSGIPPALGLAAMIGPPYNGLWPDFVAVSKRASSNLFFVETLDDQKPLLITPPTDIMQPAQPSLPQTGVSPAELRIFMKSNAIRYPKIWPFSKPFE